MVKIKVNVKTKNDSIPSDTTKRKMPVITNPKIRRTPRRDDTNCYTNIAVILVILFLGIQQFFRNIKSGQH